MSWLGRSSSSFHSANQLFFLFLSTRSVESFPREQWGKVNLFDHSDINSNRDWAGERNFQPNVDLAMSTGSVGASWAAVKKKIYTLEGEIKESRQAAAGEWKEISARAWEANGPFIEKILDDELPKAF